MESQISDDNEEADLQFYDYPEEIFDDEIIDLVSLDAVTKRGRPKIPDHWTRVISF